MKCGFHLQEALPSTGPVQSQVRAIRSKWLGCANISPGCCPKGEAHWDLGVCGAVPLLSEPHLLFPMECRTEKEKREGWGQAVSSMASRLKQPSRTSSSGKTGWLRIELDSPSHTQAHLCSTLGSQLWAIRAISRFFLFPKTFQSPELRWNYAHI